MVEVEGSKNFIADKSRKLSKGYEVEMIQPVAGINRHVISASNY